MAEPDLEPLFRGAARLGLLLGALDLPWAEVAPIVARFPSELARGLELGVASDGPPLWLRSQADGQPACFRVARFMEERGVPETELRRLLVTAKHYGHRHLLFELGVDAGGFVAFRWFMRQPVSLAEAAAFLEAAGGDTLSQARLVRVAEALLRQQVHGLGEERGPGGQTQQLLVFGQEGAGSAWPRIEEAALRLGIGTSTWAPLAGLMPQLAGRDSKVVLLASQGQIAPALRLLVAEAPVAAARDLLRARGLDRRVEALDLLTELAQRQNLDQLEVQTHEGRLPQALAWTKTALPFS